MESSSSSSSFQSLGSSEYAISHLDRFNLFILRPFLAASFVLSFILLGWVLAWKLVLVHVPLVQEIFGLRNKPRKSKPQTGRLSRFYSNINARDPASGWSISFLYFYFFFTFNYRNVKLVASISW